MLGLNHLHSAPTPFAKAAHLWENAQKTTNFRSPITSIQDEAFALFAENSKYLANPWNKAFVYARTGLLNRVPAVFGSTCKLDSENQHCFRLDKRKSESGNLQKARTLDPILQKGQKLG